MRISDWSSDVCSSDLNLVDDVKVNYSMASQTVFPALLRSDRLPQSLIEELGVALDNSSDLLEGYINEVITRFPDKVKQYKSGKKGLLGLFMGEVMKMSKGKIDPKEASRMMQEKLDKA